MPIGRSDDGVSVVFLLVGDCVRLVSSQEEARGGAIAWWKDGGGRVVVVFVCVCVCMRVRGRPWTPSTSPSSCWLATE